MGGDTAGAGVASVAGVGGVAGHFFAKAGVSAVVAIVHSVNTISSQTRLQTDFAKYIIRCCPCERVRPMRKWCLCLIRQTRVSSNAGRV